MITSKEKSLFDALERTSQRSLPEEWDGESEFTDAIYLIRKSDGRRYYAIGKRDDSGNDIITVDLGTVSVIVSIESIHPYIYKRPHIKEGSTTDKPAPNGRVIVPRREAVVTPRKENTVPVRKEDAVTPTREAVVTQKKENAVPARKKSVVPKPASKTAAAFANTTSKDVETSGAELDVPKLLSDRAALLVQYGIITSEESEKMDRHEINKAMYILNNKIKSGRIKKL